MAEVIETAFSYQNSFEYAEMLAKMRVGVTNGTNIADSVGTGITYQLVSQAVEKALEAPEDFVWSYIAVMFYNNQEQHSLYLTADYSDDKRILAVVENFEKQFEKQLGKDITKEERLGIKKLVMQTYLRALALDKCADYGLEALKEFDNFFIRENTMYALLKTGRYDECLIDGQQHHIRMQRLTFFQQGQHGIFVLSESGDGFTQPQSHAVSAHFRMDKARHIRIQRR